MKNYYFTSDKYLVTVIKDGEVCQLPVSLALICDGDGNNKELPPEVAAEYDGLGMGTNTTKTCFTSFEFDGTAEISVQTNAKAVTVKPILPHTFDVETGIVTLAVNGDCSFVIQPDGDIFGGLHVFCNKRRPIPQGKRHVIKFPAGVHTEENSPHIQNDEHGNPMVVGITDDTLIYLDHGAVVCANIELRGLQNVTVAGTGILSTIHRCHGAEANFDLPKLWGAFRYHAKPSIHVRSGCRNIEINGVILNSEFRNIVIRNSDHITINNVKMFGSVENGDGINCYNTSELLVDGCYIYSCDDCFCMYNACDSIPTLFDEGYDNVTAVCRNVEVKNCLMCSASRPVVLGGHATGSTDPRCLIENIQIHDCYIMETPKRIFGCSREREMRWSGHLRILSQSEQIVRNICFSDIRIDNTRGCISKPIHIEVRGNANASYTESQGYRIENITFRNITVGGHTEECLPIVICCRQPRDESDNCGISGITFDNVTFGGKPVDLLDIHTEGKARIESLSINQV